MSDAQVGQLQRLHDITAEQLAAYPARVIGLLGVAGGNGLDLIDPGTTDAVFGYDINADYLDACEARYEAGTSPLLSSSCPIVVLRLAVAMEGFSAAEGKASVRRDFFVGNRRPSGRSTTRR